MSIYNAALDIGSWPFFFKMKRWQIATGLSAIVFGLTYLLVIVTNFLTNLDVVRDDHGRHRDALDGDRRDPLPHEPGQLQHHRSARLRHARTARAVLVLQRRSIHAPLSAGQAESPSGSCSRPRPCSPVRSRTP